MNPFTFHTGIEFSQGNSQFMGQCPFCQKEEKFHFNENYLWDCKNANCVNPSTGKQRSGNLSSFLQQLYEEHETVSKAAQLVGKWRQLPQGRVSQLGLKYNPWNDSILIPTYRNGKINNLYKVVTTPDGKQRILCTPEVEHTLFNYPEDANDIVWVVEGHWDRIAAEAIVGNLGITIIAVPGAGVWKKSWTDILADKDVVFCYDNDDSGRNGFEKVIIKHIASHNRKPKSISFINWKKGKIKVVEGSSTKEHVDIPHKFDLNDAYIEWGRKAIDHIEEMIEPFEAPESTIVISSTIESVKPNMEIKSYDMLLDEFKKIYHVTEDMELCLLLALTSIYSINIGGEQLWLRVIGPPGCGKTTIAKAISASDQVVLKSTFTGLFSGWHDDKDTDASMVPLISGKTLVVKDADALLRQPNVEKIFSELRDFYDKDSSTQYKNRVAHDYRNIPCTMILCGTNVLRRSDQSFLGERFLDMEMRISQHDEDLISQKMLERSMALALDHSNLPPETPVQAAAKGFIEHLMNRKIDYSPSVKLQKEVRTFAKVASLMRTKVDREAFGRGDIRFAPVPELPTRLIGQLMKTVMCVPMVTGIKDEVMNRKMLRKITQDIIDPTANRTVLSNILMEGWYTRDELMEHTNIPKSTLDRELNDLVALKLVDMKKVAGINKRYKVLSFTLTDSVKEALISVNSDN